MAWSSALLNSDYQAWLADDKPLVGTRNVLTEATSLLWKSLSGGTTSSNGDEARAHDGKTSLSTSPAVASATRALHATFPSGGASDFDFIAVQLDPDSLLTEIRLDIADDSAYSVNYAQAVGAISGGAQNNARCIDLELRDGGTGPNVYSGVEFLRILFFYSGSFNAPAVREIFIGSRIQLQHNPRVPWDNKGLHGHTAKTQAHSGEQTRYVYAKGRRDIIANLNPGVDARADDIESIYTLSDYGNAPMIWIDQPSTAPDSFNLVHQREPELLMPYVGPYERTVTLDLEEQGPHYLAIE